MIRPSAAGERQRQAADPAQSTWLAANAGSGKTRVLIDRVVRMLFAGTPPHRILCLTYTKAAATEMQNRLFRTLGLWAMLPEPELRQALSELGAPVSTAADLATARRLFAQAIETPGGLRIQTIHSFCAGLLRRFPLEARVAPNFAEMDDTETRAQRAAVLEDMAAGPEAQLIDNLAGFLSGDDLGSLVGEICNNRDGFPSDASRNNFLRQAGLPDGFAQRDLLADVLLGGEAELIAALLPHLEAAGGNDAKAAAKLRDLRLEVPAAATVKALEGVFLFGADAKAPHSAKIGNFPTKATREKSAAHLMPQLEALMARVEAARPRRLALRSAERNLALHRFAAAFLPLYRERKHRRGLLDFDDLIASAAALLSDRSVAQWVLYRLDGGLDHILVDEAQDTSPRQWTVIERLAEEFFAGQGARSEARTIFVVGDKKQSIYSFQGADLAEFDRMHRHFGGRVAPRGGWQSLSLEHSFRSAQSILNLVDHTFDDSVQAALGGPTLHLAQDQDRPGRVDLWAPEPANDKTEPDSYFDPTFVQSDQDAPSRLALRIAVEVRRIIDAGTRVHTRDGIKTVDEGDILILFKARNRLFLPTLRACKAAGLQVAGADRLRLASEIAVRDLTALLGFLALPEDDLALATSLRSPLFGWSEGELFRLAANRPEGRSLWEAMRQSRDDGDPTRAVLSDMLDKADYYRPFELIDRALMHHGLRRRLVARLGAEAEDGIDELLSQSLAYERAAVPSLTGFLVRLEGDHEDVKRRVDSGAKALRLMTVHGAKGLEAPIVILPDTAKPSKPGQVREQILRDADGRALWRGNKDEMPPSVAALLGEAAEREEHERLRLLYVAMTRAESWLIVAAAGDVGSGNDSWYSIVGRGMERAGAARPEPGPDGGEAVLRLENGAWPEPDAAPRGETTPVPLPDLPDWAERAAPAPTVPPPALSPSALGGAKALPGEAGLDEEAALLRGTRLHALLEHLPAWPKAEWGDLAATLLSMGDSPADLAETETVLAEARSVLTSAALRPFLGSDTLSEVEITGTLPELGGRQLRGAIDRLVVRPDRIVAIDYKSNAIVPERPEDVPDGILRQMGAYAALLAQVYPGRRVETAILWTRTGALMWLSPDIVRAALQSTAIP